MKNIKTNLNKKNIKNELVKNRKFFNDKTPFSRVEIYNFQIEEEIYNKKHNKDMEIKTMNNTNKNTNLINEKPLTNAQIKVQENNIKKLKVIKKFNDSLSIEMISNIDSLLVINNATEQQTNEYNHAINQFYNYILYNHTYYALAYKLSIAYLKMRVIKVNLISDIKSLNCMCYAFSLYMNSILNKNNVIYENDNINTQKHIEFLIDTNNIDILQEFTCLLYCNNIKQLQRVENLQEYEHKLSEIFKTCLKQYAHNEYIKKIGASKNSLENNYHKCDIKTRDYILKSMFEYNLIQQKSTYNLVNRILTTYKKDLTKNDLIALNNLVRKIEKKQEKNNK